jgi:hypothetical protein
MAKTRMVSLFAVVLLAGGVWCAVAHSQRPLPGRNLALHRPYTLAPAPRYDLTTDAGDATQLTDGALSLPVGTIWRHTTTVGWELVPWARVTIDLGAPADLGVVAAHTGAGAAGVGWPGPLVVLVGDRPDELHPAGELVAGAHAANGYDAAWYASVPLGVRARYVTLMCAVPNRQYLFLDEIQVMAAERLAKPSTTAVAADPVAYLRRRAIASHIRVRLDTDRATLASLIANAPAAARAALSRQLDSVLVAANAMPPIGDDFTTRLPLSPAHRQLFGVQAALWRALGVTTAAWLTPRWDPASHLLIPPPSALAVDVEVARGRDRRSVLLTLANAAPDDAVAELRLEGASGCDWSARPVEWTDSAEGNVIASALGEPSPIAGGYRVTVPSGLPRQVWLTFAAGSLPPGEQRATLRLTLGGRAIAVPVRLQVATARLDGVSLHTGGFDYPTRPIYDLGDGNRDQIVQLLRDHLIDTTWGTTDVMPLPPVATPTGPIDSAALARWTAHTWPNAARYAVFVNVPAWRQPGPEVARWLGEWSARSAALGLPKGALWALLVDEPNGAANVARAVAWAQAIRAQGGAIGVLEDPTTTDPAALDALGASVDVLVANRKLLAEKGAGYRAAFAHACAGRRCELGLYDSVSQAHQLDPYRYYRLQAWLVFRMGGATSLFWSFADDGGFAGWNDFWATRGPSYSPLYLAANMVSGSKQLAALREGIEDYETLAELARAVAAARQRSVPAASLAAAESLLGHELDALLGDDSPALYSWNATQDRSGADRLRHELLRQIAALAPR